MPSPPEFRLPTSNADSLPPELHERPLAFVVNAPENFQHSNGIRVFLDAIQAARQLGVDAVVVPAEKMEPSYRTLPPPFADLPVAWQVPDGCFAIVGDTCCPERLIETRARAFQVCHYALAPLGLFRGAGTSSNFQLLLPGEKQAVYSPQISTRLPQFYLQTRFPELESWLASTRREPARRRPGRTLRLCIYAGKGQLRPLTYRPLRQRTALYQATLLTRFQPATKPDLYRSLSAADLLISFDPISSLNHEAILLGTPALVLSAWDEMNFLDHFPVSLEGVAWNNFDQAIDMADHGYDHASVYASYESALARNTQNLVALIAYAVSPLGASMSAATVNAYWAGRQEFFASLQLPSAPPHWGPLEKALPPLTIREHTHLLLKIATKTVRSRWNNLLYRCRRRLRRLVCGRP